MDPSVGLEMASGYSGHSPIVSATVIGGPWGPLFLATTPLGLAAVDLTGARETFESGLDRRFGVRPEWIPDPDPARREPARHDPASHDPASLGLAPTAATEPTPMNVPHALLWQATAAIVAGLGGDDAGLADLPLDIDDRPAWDRRVLGAVRAIPRGQTRSYGEIAEAIGSPGAARAVGGAVGRNPIAYVIPCHRVIAADGTLGGYGGGWWGDRERLLDVKSALLAREGRHVPLRAPGAKAGG